ncbi:hypothetical protein PIB30_030476 [Stylosanthes scabra]|uniref:Pectinesterase inhibitor domain-containing protein n=1 Tax=Stylosanthes scabra TaxID=79078 RepID=A0ABU6UEV1_9FABA|nr:hypothetical protein [Stylosanthes scabra]
MARNLKHLSPLIFTIQVLVTISIIMSIGECRVYHPNDDTLVESSCKQTPDPNLCLQIFNSYPRSRTADLRGLGLILVDAIKTRSIPTLNKINQLHQGASGKLRGALASCSESYKGILNGDISVAIAGIESWNFKFAEQAVTDAALEVKYCQEEFNGIPSPIANENNFVRGAANIAQVIVRLMY